MRRVRNKSVKACLKVATVTNVALKIVTDLDRVDGAGEMSRDAVVGRRLDRHQVSARHGKHRREQPETAELKPGGGMG